MEASAFVDAVGRFSAWAQTVPVEHRNGEWECDYPAWPEIYAAWESLLAAAPIEGWPFALVDTALYTIARDNECQALAREVPTASLRFLAEEALARGEAEVKWQLAVEIGTRCVGGCEELLVRFADDDDEYVRRRAVQSLALVGSAPRAPRRA